MEERLQKIIARAGLGSRRAAEQMMSQGRVTVDGKVVKEMGTRANPAKNEIRVDGVRVKVDRPRRYILMHKPRGYLTTRSDPGRRPTVMQLLPQALQTLFPVGRLDMQSSGLLILTDDGEFAQKVAHPRHGVPKTYVATVRGRPDGKTLGRLRKGLRIEGEAMRVESVETLEVTHREPIGAARGKARFLPEHKPRTEKIRAGAASLRGDVAGRQIKSRLRVVLREGKNREIRRLLAALGHPVLSLHRERVGSLSDRSLPPGAYRRLTPEEIRGLVEREP